MINCQRIGEISISGDEATILTEFGYIANNLIHAGCDVKTLISTFITGLYMDDIVKSNTPVETHFEEIDKMVDEFLGEEEKA